MGVYHNSSSNMPSQFCLKVRDGIQWWCSLFFLFAVLFGLVFVIILHLKVSDKLDETRCKCVCPHNLKTTDTYNTTVFLEHVNEATECICENIVPSSSEVLCLQCQCTFETRNKLLIGGIIVAVLVVIGLLSLYTLVHILIQIVSHKNFMARSEYQVLNDSTSVNGSIDSTSNIVRFASAFRSRISRERSTGYN